MSLSNPKKILIIKHGSLGDIVFALEPILAIKNKFDNSVIDLVTEEKFISLFKKIKMFDQFIIDNRIGLFSTLSIITKIISGKYKRSSKTNVKGARKKGATLRDWFEKEDWRRVDDPSKKCGE